jgi:hypothetical protein
MDQFEEDILDEKVDKALFVMQFDKVEINEEQVPSFLIEARHILNKYFLLNTVGNKELRELTLKKNKVEKKYVIYATQLVHNLPLNSKTLSFQITRAIKRSLYGRSLCSVRLFQSVNLMFS